MIESLIH